MGYALTLPSGLFKIASGGFGSPVLTMTTVSANDTFGTLTTPNYKQPLSYAYLDYCCEAIADDSGALNSFDNAGGGHLGLDSGGATWNASANFPDQIFRCPANAYLSGGFRVPGRLNIASLLSPNTNYTVHFMHMQSLGDHLYMYSPYVELNLYFGV